MKSFTTLAWTNVASIVAIALFVYLTKSNWFLWALIVPILTTISHFFLALFLGSEAGGQNNENLTIK